MYSKKVFELKKSINVSFLVLSGRMQYPSLLFMSLFSSSKMPVEDGVGEYVHEKSENK